MSDFKEEKLISGKNTVSFTTTGGYVTGWQIFNTKTQKLEEILYKGKSLKRTGIPPLFPCWNDSGTNLRKHGFARDCNWKLTEKKSDSAEMTLNSQDIYPQIKDEYPFDFSLKVSLKLEDNNLFYSMTVYNTGNKDLPIAPALHPYFFIRHQDKNNLKVEGAPGFFAQDFDWDISPPDNDYDFYKEAKIILPERKIIITDLSTPLVIKKLVIWSQPKDKEDFDFVCVEPVTGLFKSIQKKEILVRPGDPWKMDLCFTALFD